MKAIIAIALSLMLPLLGLNGVASAQSTVAVRGTIAAVDCQSGTVVVNTASGQQTFDASNDSYASVDATNLPFCSLEGYVGAPATVWLTASGDQLRRHGCERHRSHRRGPGRGTGRGSAPHLGYRAGNGRGHGTSLPGSLRP